MAVAHSLRIGELAAAAGVAASTVRYYERRGLLRPDGRSSSSYREYGQAALDRLRFIRAAQANGFTLEDVAALLSFRDGAAAPCRSVQSLIEERLADLERRLRELRHVQRVLRASLRRCRTGEPRGRCDVLEGLERASATGRAGREVRRSSRKSSENPLTWNPGSSRKVIP